MTNPPAETDPLITEVRALRAEIEIFNTHRFVRIQNKPWRLFFNRFLMGIAMGFGTVFGATVLVSVVIYSLQGIDWLPIIGDWASEIATQMQGEVGQNSQP